MAPKMHSFLSRSTILGGLAVAALAATVGLEGSANAQEIQLTGPLKGAPAVRRLRLYREGRFEIAPAFTFTLLDEYRRTILVGGRINYGVTDWLSIGVWGGFGAVGISTSLADGIDGAARQGTVKGNVAGEANSGAFQAQVAQISYMAMPQITAVPFRGKFALFQSVFADVDLYIFAGFGIAGTKERQDCTSFKDCSGKFQLESKSHPAPTWGLGFNFYLNKFLALGLEYRMVPFAWNRSGFDSRGEDQKRLPDTAGKFPDGAVNSTDATYRFNQMLSVSLGFSFPTAPKTTD